MGYWDEKRPAPTPGQTSRAKQVPRTRLDPDRLCVVARRVADQVLYWLFAVLFGSLLIASVVTGDREVDWGEMGGSGGGVTLDEWADSYEDPTQQARDAVDSRVMRGERDATRAARMSGGTRGGNRYDCEEFASRAEAKAYYEDHPSDRNWLDGDNEGRACEWGM